METGRSADTLSQNGHLRWVFFDFAGTLAFNDPPRVWHYLRACARRGVFLNRRDVWAALREVWATVDCQEGIAHPEASQDAGAYDAFRSEIEEQILARLGVTKERAEIIGELLAIQDDPRAYTVYPETPEMLPLLRDAGYQLCVVSNFTWGLPDIVTGLGLAPYFSAVVTSARVGFRKPHPRIYQAALEATGATPQQTLFIGDSLEADITGPTERGFQTLLVDRRRNGRYPVPSIGSLSDLRDVLNLLSNGVFSGASAPPVQPHLALPTL
ncbi:MAG: HAD family hydrolase [Chloroflexi bacterium]|nr:HAD family hydrolase [Chloroflexota bacterium]